MEFAPFYNYRIAHIFRLQPYQGRTLFNIDLIVFSSSTFYTRREKTIAGYRLFNFLIVFCFLLKMADIVPTLNRNDIRHLFDDPFVSIS